MAHWVVDPWGGSTHAYADLILEAERPSTSGLLGPDGRPLSYEPRQRVGFDLQPKERAKKWDE